MTAVCRRNAVLITLLACCLLPGLLQADQIKMKNGDVISGNISRIEDDKVYIDPAYADEFSVKIAEVVSIETEQVFEVELEGGDEVNAQFAGADGEQQVLILEGEEMAVGLADVALAKEPEKYYDRESHIDLNMAWNEGNTDSRANFLFADTKLKKGDHRHLAELTIRRDETDNESTKEQDLFRYSYNWLFSDPWYVGANFSFERDPIRDLDHRYIIGAILGRDIFRDSRKFLTASLGIGYSQEEILGFSDSGATGLWNLDYEHDFRNGDLVIFHNHNLNYQFYGDNNLILKTNTGFRFDVYKDVYTSISLRYDYETEPAPGAENYDTTLAVGVGAKF